MAEQKTGVDLQRLKSEVLGRELMQHVFECGMCSLDNTLTLGIVGDSKFVINAKLGEELLKGGRAVGRPIVSFDSFRGA